MAYTTAEKIIAFAGHTATDLRVDDDDADDLLAEAVAYAGGRIDFYCAKFAASELAASRWVQDVATLLACRWLCLRRFNEVPQSIEDEYLERLEELQMILAGKATVPGAAASRRAVTVTNHTVDLRRANNQVRVDRSRSTGVAKGYRRPTDPNAESVDSR